MANDQLLDLAVGTYVAVLVSFVVASIWQNDKVRRIILYGYLLLLTTFIFFISVCSFMVAASLEQIFAGRTVGRYVANSILPDQPYLYMFFGYLCFLFVPMSGSWNAIIYDLAEHKAITPSEGTLILMGGILGRTILPPIVFYMLGGSNQDNCIFTFTNAIVPQLLYIFSNLALIPLEVLFEFLTKFGRQIAYQSSLQSPFDALAYFHVITKEMANSIVEMDYMVMRELLLGGIQKKRPLFYYLCKEDDVIEECFIYSNDTVIPNDDFYNTVLNSNDGNYYWVNNITIRRANIVDVDIENCNVMAGYDRVTESVQTLIFQYPNFTSSNVQHCRHLLAGAGLCNTDVLPVGWPKIDLSETSGAFLVGLPVLLLGWFTLACSVKLMCIFLQGIPADVLRLTFEHKYEDRKDTHILLRVALRVLFCLAFFIPSLVLTIVTGNVQLTLTIIMAISALLKDGKQDQFMIMILGAEVGSFIGFAIYPTASTTDIFRRVQLAWARVCYNIFGLLLFHILPLALRGESLLLRAATAISLPIKRYAWWSRTYLFLTFVLVPSIVLFFASFGQILFIVIAGICYSIAFIILLLNVIQNKRPHFLPVWLRTWQFLPLYLRSLEVYEHLWTDCYSRMYQRCCGHNNDSENSEDEHPGAKHGKPSKSNRFMKKKNDQHSSSSSSSSSSKGKSKAMKIKLQRFNIPPSS